jgi:hypothetical protein
MSTGWEDYEPAPLEFFHGELMDGFHEYRKSVTENTTVEINGTILSKIIAKAKRSTKAKYPDSILPKDAILKTEFK